MMQIKLNNISVKVEEGDTIHRLAERNGFSIPTLCHAENAKHKSSCMVCAVKNQFGQILPSCSTLVTDGMEIDTESEEVKDIRLQSLELLLSDHRADCEAPCSLVCPKGLNVELMLSYYDNANEQAAFDVIASAFNLPEIGCDNCKAPCEKACRRGTVDTAVTIREIIREVVGKFEGNNPSKVYTNTVQNKQFQSRIGLFTDEEKHLL